MRVLEVINHGRQVTAADQGAEESLLGMTGRVAWVMSHPSH